ncbi:MAG: hypothetical protein ABIR17_00930 [Pseudolysinimonas sp.]|uniref:hypothetical protein n=1 Tax=Pseudolysinimonas sp. TaxID=2680009 RepID=UPI00326690FC
MNEFDELKQLAADLDAEPLARIMVGHRELFHSNLLAWFYERLPEIADKVFPSSTPGPGSPREAVRELQNLDLVLVRPGARPVIIENKVFSVPTIAQLRDYDSKLAGWWDTPARRIVLSMTQTTPPLPAIQEDPDPTGWVFWSHGDLADRLDRALIDAGEGYEVETMRHYARLLRTLSRLVELARVKHPNEFAFLRPEILEAIPARQMKQGLEKMRAEHVATLLADNATGVLADSSMTHGTPIVTLRRRLPNDPDFSEVSFQYQAGQVRRLLVTREQGRGSEAKLAREAIANRRPEMFDLTSIHKALGTEPSDERPGFKHFDPDSIYRYVSASGVTVEQLIELGKSL